MGVPVQPHTCDAGVAGPKTAWSVEEREWCCQNKNVGCDLALEVESKQETFFDCDAAKNNWVAAWSDKKKAFCCQYNQTYCADDKKWLWLALGAAFGLCACTGLAMA